MGDALCGPSNALQTFKSHTSVDRTLQQDRLVSRQAPSRGFRSQDPNAGILDPEFEAFQAGHPGALSQPDLPVFHPGQRFQQPHHGPSIVPGFAGPSQAPDWAADFQRMRISQSPLPQHFSPVPQAQNATWDGIFQRHSPGFQKASNMSPSPLAFHNRAQYGMNGGSRADTRNSSCLRKEYKRHKSNRWIWISLTTQRLSVLSMRLIKKWLCLKGNRTCTWTWKAMR
ncbi:hypothetical protein H2203_004060 [Taxawa tesnikishii (nom. ined.)]|nr:hypothetical protein H2203_004060 [Dothideales sp. JES 119]